MPAGPSPHNNDAIIYDVGADGTSKSGWGHTTCGMNGAEVAESIGAGVVTVEQTAAAKSPRPESTPSASTMDTLIQNATTPLDTTPDRTVVPAKKAD